jgi:hypothetical protein
MTINLTTQEITDAIAYHLKQTKSMDPNSFSYKLHAVVELK